MERTHGTRLPNVCKDTVNPWTKANPLSMAILNQRTLAKSTSGDKSRMTVMVARCETGFLFCLFDVCCVFERVTLM